METSGVETSGVEMSSVEMCGVGTNTKQRRDAQATTISMLNGGDAPKKEPCAESMIQSMMTGCGDEIKTATAG